MRQHGRSIRTPIPWLVLAAAVLLAACQGAPAASTGGSAGASGASAGVQAAPTATPRPTAKPKPTPKPTPFPVAGQKWLKAYCPAAQAFTDALGTYQSIQADASTLNFAAIPNQAQKLLGQVVALQALVKKIPNWGPGAAAGGQLTAAVAKLNTAATLFQKAVRTLPPDLGTLASAAAAGADAVATGAQSSGSFAQLATLTGQKCYGL